jgi:dihydropteroate synthase
MNPAPDDQRRLARAAAWDVGRTTLHAVRRPLVMGIINLTPDSFYAASRHPAAAAVEAGLTLLEQGADLLDLGAESTRPGAEPVSAAAEQERLLPAIEGLRRHTDAPLSVDTRRAATARLALDAGADAVNDVTGGRDPDLLPLVAARGVGVILMHMQGDPATMQDAPSYGDPVGEVGRWLAGRATAAEAAGIRPQRILVDPGIGFGKLLEHNLALLARLPEVALGRPLLLGASRKSFIGAVTGAGVADRLGGSLAALAAAHSGGATVVRVHDVAASVQFLDVLAAIDAARPAGQ